MGQEKTLKADLDELLSEDVSSVLEREKTAFDRLVEPFGESLVLFGAGNLGRQVLSRLRQDGIEPLAFSDNNPALWGRFIDDLQVLPPPEAAKKYGLTSAFVVTIWNTDHSFVQTRQQLLKLGCTKVVSVVTLRWKYAGTFLPFFWAELPSKTYKQKELIRSAFSLWSDEYSRREYLAQLKWRHFGDFDTLSAPVLQESYFPDDLFNLQSNESFVDCGAYDGITIKNFLKRQKIFFGRIMAFEPDPINFSRLQTYVSSLPADTINKLITLPFAVGAKRAKVRFEATASLGSSISDNGSIEVDCVALDDIMHEYQFLPTYIKMDIEGSELDALAGARTLIERHVPVLAVCVYHRYDDLWRIPLLIQSLTNKYHLSLRPHEIEGWQLVCYAIPDMRLKK